MLVCGVEAKASLGCRFLGGKFEVFSCRSEVFLGCGSEVSLSCRLEVFLGCRLEVFFCRSEVSLGCRFEVLYCGIKEAVTAFGFEKLVLGCGFEAVLL